ncbi:unnamed protein product [Thlaspi arvense]|uniref:Uncharacterized protein n=1 Tax=Thlaspi arvense TaxID=13288 RepID=A0AAU9SAG4_THLAR|nr:unnamed protein product [Thlaspi arvense]
MAWLARSIGNFLKTHEDEDEEKQTKTVVEGSGVGERDDEEFNKDEVLQGTQEQQKVNANNWRANIAATMWTGAMG